MKTTKALQKALLLGFSVESTGGGCQWLRRNRIAITDGEAGLPDAKGSVVLVTLDANGDYDELIPPMDFPSLDCALAFLKYS